MDILADLTWRGLIQDTTEPEQLGQWLAGGKRALYAGFDPTSDSLHIGSLMPLLLLRRFQKAGHCPIALVGGATGMIGDPSGKSKERVLLSQKALDENIAGLDCQMRRFLDFDGPNAARLVNNHDWMGPISFVDFLRDVGKNFPVSMMLDKDSVKCRLERADGLSYTEFSYMLLQAYDFVHLRREFDCQLQVGGSDQWGNITAGLNLARRMLSASLHGLTCPLLTKSDGSKFGKTEDGNVWLSADKTSPYAFYQYWFNVADEDAGRCLRFLTELSHEEIEALDDSRAAEPHRRESQTALATQLTQLVHGDAGLQKALRAKEVLFGKAPIEGSTDDELLEIFSDVPSQEADRNQLSGEGMLLIDALIKVGLCKSKREARQTIKDKAAYVNNRREENIETVLSDKDLAGQSVMVLRSGKKRHALLRFL